MNAKAEDLAWGRFPEILMAAGMDSRFFNHRNGPCPFCEGTDRYRWTRKPEGLWVCNNCTGGRYASGFEMLMRHLGLHTFREAADHVRHFCGAVPGLAHVTREAKAAAAKYGSPEDLARRRAKMERLWSEGVGVKPGDPVSLYLQNRVPGLQGDLADLKYHPALPYWAPGELPTDKPVLLGKFPAMLALCRDAKGEFVQLHKTYLTREGGKADVPLAKKTEQGVGSNAFAVRLMPVTGDTLGVSEGIETALGASMLRQIPVWPCLNGTVMMNFVLPEYLVGQVRRIVIFTDHDERKHIGGHAKQAMRRPGDHYADSLAQRMLAQKIRVLKLKVGGVGNDFADHWAQRHAAAVA